VFFCLFQTALIFFLNARVQKRKWWQRTGKRKKPLCAFSPKFEFHSREAWMEFKLDEDT